MFKKIIKIVFYVFSVFAILHFLVYATGLYILEIPFKIIFSFLGNPFLASHGTEILFYIYLVLILFPVGIWSLIKKLKDPLVSKTSKLFFGLFGIVLFIWAGYMISLPFKNGYVYLPGQAPKQIPSLSEYVSKQDQQRQDCVNRYMVNSPEFEICLNGYGLKK